MVPVFKNRKESSISLITPPYCVYEVWQSVEFGPVICYFNFQGQNRAARLG